MLHYALTTERLRILVRVELVHLLVLLAEAKVFGLLINRDALVITEELPDVVDLLVVRGAEVLHVVDTIPFGWFSADCAVLDVSLSILIERIDLDFGLHHVEQADLLAVMDGVRVGEVSCRLLFILKENRIVVFWYRFLSLVCSISIIDLFHIGSPDGDLEEKECVSVVSLDLVGILDDRAHFELRMFFSLLEDHSLMLVYIGL